MVVFSVEISAKLLQATVGPLNFRALGKRLPELRCRRFLKRWKALALSFPTVQKSGRTELRKAFLKRVEVGDLESTEHAGTPQTTPYLTCIVHLFGALRVSPRISGARWRKSRPLGKWLPELRLA